MSDPQSYQPGRFEDIPWRVGYRLRRFAFHIFGPPQMSGRFDPHNRLAAERDARYAARGTARGDSAG